MSADRPSEREGPTESKPPGHPATLSVRGQEWLTDDPVTGPTAAGSTPRAGWSLGDWSRQEAQVLRGRLMRIRRRPPDG